MLLTLREKNALICQIEPCSTLDRKKGTLARHNTEVTLLYLSVVPCTGKTHQPNQLTGTAAYHLTVITTYMGR